MFILQHLLLFNPNSSLGFAAIVNTDARSLRAFISADLAAENFPFSDHGLGRIDLAFAGGTGTFDRLRHRMPPFEITPTIVASLG